MGEYEPVIPFQIQGICSLKDENGNVVFPVTAFQICGTYNSNHKSIYTQKPVTTFQICGAYNTVKSLGKEYTPVNAFQIPGVYNAEFLYYMVGIACHHPSVATELKDYRLEKIVRTNHRRPLLSYIFAYHIPNGHFTDTPG